MADTNKDKKRKENKEVRELHKETKRDIRRANRIPFATRREIAKRAKTEAGYYGGEGGKGKKLRTGGKGKYNLKGGKGGTKQGYEKKPTPPPPSSPPSSAAPASSVKSRAKHTDRLTYKNKFIKICTVMIKTSN